MGRFRKAAMAAAMVVGLLVQGGLSARGQTRPGLSVTFDDKGLSAVRYGDAEVVQPGPMGVRAIDLRHGFPPAATRSAPRRRRWRSPPPLTG